MFSRHQIKRLMHEQIERAFLHIWLHCSYEPDATHP